MVCISIICVNYDCISNNEVVAKHLFDFMYHHNYDDFKMVNCSSAILLILIL